MPQSTGELRRIDARLRELLEGNDLAVTNPVLAEVCAGTRTDQCELDLRGLLSRCASLPFDPAIDFDGAVAVYRSRRKVGVTPLGLIDCMIASVALHHEIAVLARDVDLEHMAEVVPLRLDLER